MPIWFYNKLYMYFNILNDLVLNNKLLGLIKIRWIIRGIKRCNLRIWLSECRPIILDILFRNYDI